jgi:1,4-alpha-glucan branching enzyme
VRDKQDLEITTSAPSRPSDAQLLLRAEHSDPFAYLGPHAIQPGGNRYVVRSIQPQAVSLHVLIGGQEIAAQRIDPGGVFEAELPSSIRERPSPRDYRLRARWQDGHTTEFADPYAFPPVLSEFDLHLIGEGTHYQKYEKMGAHVTVVEGVRGVQFAVWAPNAGCPMLRVVKRGGLRVLGFRVCSHRYKIRSARKCHPCDRYVV